jgi:hypothetical protein
MARDQIADTTASIIADALRWLTDSAPLLGSMATPEALRRMSARLVADGRELRQSAEKARQRSIALRASAEAARDRVVAIKQRRSSEDPRRLPPVT